MITNSISNTIPTVLYYMVCINNQYNRYKENEWKIDDYFS